VEENNLVPTYYIISRTLSPKQLDCARHAFNISPVCCSIITTIYDIELAHIFCPDVIQTTTLENAHQLAKQLAENTGQPVLIIDEIEYLDAYYNDGIPQHITADIS
jgi:hypothetical protein